MRRNAERGVHALTFTENPAAMGYPSFHDEYWTPVWEELVDTDTVMNVHIGSSGRLAITAPDAPMDVMITLQPMNIVQAAADLLWSTPIKKYPDLKIALSGPLAPQEGFEPRCAYLAGAAGQGRCLSEVSLVTGCPADCYWRHS